MNNETMTEWRRQMQAKFDNIMSGHNVNEDDRDWLRALLDARLRGEAAQAEQQAVAFDAVCRLPAEWRKRWDTAESDHKPALNLWMAAGELEAALSAAPAAPARPSIVCEHCPTQFHGTDDAAEAGGWVSGWDGWECPAHKEERSAAPAPVAGDADD